MKYKGHFSHVKLYVFIFRNLQSPIYDLCLFNMFFPFIYFGKNSVLDEQIYRQNHDNVDIFAKDSRNMWNYEY